MCLRTDAGVFNGSGVDTVEHHITAMLEHMADSDQQLAEILAAGRDIAVHMSYLVETIPNENFTFEDLETIAESASLVNASVVAYLNSIGGLEEAIAEHLQCVMKELATDEEDE